MAAGFAMGKIVKVGKRLGSVLVRSDYSLTKAVIEGIVHRNSLAYRGDTHVYKIMNTITGEVYKIGESAMGLNKAGQSRRAEAQARKLFKQIGYKFETEVIETLLGKLEARQLETQLIREIRIANPKALPGNKGVH